MNWLMIILRIIHIFSGVTWMGLAIFNASYLQPAVAATGAEGQKVMGYIARRTNLTTMVYTTSTLVVLSGLTMYGILTGFRLAAMLTPYFLTLAIGAVFAIVAWVIVIVIVRGIFTQMSAIGMAIQKQGGPPTPEQGAQMGALSGRLASLGRLGVGLLMVTLLCMAIAQYVG
jgi:uncharacterized membrane protein